ncbi:MAG: asparagine synthase (glutamine-hydrolyzing) [Vicinamibacterales bacterium]
MCGLVGIAAQAPITARSWVAEGREAMRHRGPDDQGEWWAADGRAGFGFARLAILDLSSAGHQPMQDAAAELCIVFNGEIYNFVELRAELASMGVAFRSHSDTEVLLEAYRTWGPDCLARLNGMFAFAIYDARREWVFLARDRAGEKPLFYVEHLGTLRFASELKGLLADTTLPRRVDRQALDQLLADGYIPGDACIFEGMRKLPAAHALVFDLRTGTVRRWRYWTAPHPPATLADGVTEGDLLAQLETLLEGAVRSRLVADVPVGILLSGGVDSSLVAAMAARSARRLKTFTVRFPGFGKYDETEHARLVASHLGTEHIELEAGDTGVDLLPLLARQCDEPMIDSSLVPTYLLSRTIREHCTVALGGDGADELFGGYPHYDRLLRLEQAVGFIPRPLRMAAARAGGPALKVGSKGYNWLPALAADFARDVPLIGTHFDLSTRRRLVRGRQVWPFVAEQRRARRQPAIGNLAERAMRLDFDSYLPEDILVKTDRASMLTSLELRAPMLDIGVMEFALGSVPSYLKVTPSSRKVLLKRLCARLLPRAFDVQRKQGFSIPLLSWLRGGAWRDYFRDVLFDREQVLFDHRAVEALFHGIDRGRANGERLFGLVMFELWRREYRPSIP